MDNGLYKNAVLNFGTTLEALLNKNLQDKKLCDLIKDYSGATDKTAMTENEMTSIRNLRNKVHPHRISQTQDITRKEAINTRNQLEIIINTMHQTLNFYLILSVILKFVILTNFPQK